uniref:Gypsy retrotransposon integrase-like protein 1 n=2 Tax=Iconisemion striatum TaxID=60296 RepID=A0A1A7YSF0_9TELE
MATIGTLAAFDAKSHSWEEYCEIMDQFFEANEINDGEKQRAILLSVVGASTYSLMRNLLSPIKPKEKTYDELVTLLKNHFDPKPSEIVQRYKFDSRSRKPEESVMEYVAELRRLAQDCNYGNTLEQKLRDRLVCGINEDRIQRRLLSEVDLTCEKALSIAVAAETANKNAQDLQNPSMSGKCFKLHKSSQQRSTFKNSSIQECYRCKGQHHPAECKFKQEKCHACKKVGHIARACRNKSKQEGKATFGMKKEPLRSSYRSHNVQEHREESHTDSSEEDSFPLRSMNFQIGRMSDISMRKVDPYTESMKVNGKRVQFEIDTGCSLTVMNEKTFQDTWRSNKCPPIKPVKIKLETYTGEAVEVVGAAQVKVRYKTQRAKLPLLVVKGDGPTLLGRGWLEELKLSWEEIKARHQDSKIHHVSVEKNKKHLDESLQSILSKHEEVFKEELGTLKGTKATIHVNEDATPRFYRPRSIPYAMRAKVDEEIDRLLKEDVITPVKYSEWAAPVVPILKPEGTVRLCGDYKLTVNVVSTLEQYPIPRVEDLFNALSKGVQFSKLDMSHAYQQILMEENSKKYLTVNTHRGLFTYNRLPFGVASAPAIFQRTMESLLKGIPMVAVYLDDVLVSGVDAADHIKNLDEVLTRLNEAGLRLKRNKCVFMRDEVEYLGYRVDAQGLHPMDKKVKAIHEAPAPKNVTELKSFLGLLNYYNKFLPNLATTLAPLHELLKQDGKWKWHKEQEEAFAAAKGLLHSSDVLVHYSADRELILSSDASPYGVGAVLSHIMEDGTERPIGFASRTLQPAETRYSQLDKEGLAVIFGIEKFHKYLYGRSFTVFTDHKPLIYLFNEKKSIPQMGSPRVQRWAVKLSAYKYNIVYKPGKHHANADALSRLPVPVTLKKEERLEQVLMMDVLEESLINADQIKRWTSKDPVLSQVHEFLLKGWPNGDNEDLNLKPYSQRRRELSVRDGCILWGARVVIPPKGRGGMLQLLHQTHTGMTKMKGLARSYMWWPGMDLDVERTVHACSECQAHQKEPVPAPLHPWEWPESPWSRIHVDYAGPFLGEMFLVIVDAHSKWLDIYPTKACTSHVTIAKLRQSFSVYGIPKMLVSDNGTCFTSAEFETFMKRNGITHVRSAPFHPSSNGLAERAVQTFKEGMKKMKEGDIQTRLARFLFSYRITPHATTGLSPAELLMSRKLRSTLDLVVPDLKTKVRHKQMKQKRDHDAHCKERGFTPGDDVLIRNYSYGPKWIPGVIQTSTGPLSYSVCVGTGHVVKRHVDQVRARVTDPGLPVEIERERVIVPEATQKVVECAGTAQSQGSVERNSDVQEESVRSTTLETETDSEIIKAPGARCSTRERRAPDYLKDFVR